MTVFCCFFADSVIAQVTNTNFFWGGTVNNSWSTAANWSRTGKFIHTANYASGSTTVTIVTANLATTTTVMAVGDAIVGPGIPANTTISAFSAVAAAGTTITLSQATTASGSAVNVQTYLKSTLLPVATTGTSTAGTTSTAIIDNGANPVITTTGAACSVLLMRNQFATSSISTLTIDTGGILTINHYSSAPVSLAGGNVVNNGTFNITSTSVAASTAITCATPTVAPAVASEFGYSGSGALNINIATAAAANSAAVAVTSLNANTTYRMLFNGATSITLSSSTFTSFAFRAAGGALASPLIIGGAGFTIGTVGVPVNGGLISLGAQSTVTVDTGTTLTFNSASTNLTQGITSFSTSAVATTFTNKGTINLQGASTRSGLFFSTGAAAGITVVFTISNQGTLNVNLNSSGVGQSAFGIGNGGGTATGVGSGVFVTNTGTMTLKNTSTAAGTGAAIFGVVAGETPPLTITNNGTLNLEGTSYSYGNKVTINNNAILNSNSELRSFTAINNNVGGSINFVKTAATATSRQVTFNGLLATDLSGAIGSVYSDGTNNYVVVSQKFGSGTTLVANVLSSATIATGAGSLSIVSGGSTNPIAFTSVTVPALNGALSSTTTNSGTVNTDTASNLNIIGGVSAASAGAIAPGGASGKGIVDFNSGSTLAINSILKLQVSGSAVTGVDYDKVINSAVGGGFDLSAAILDVTGIYTPSGYTVIDIVSTEATGTLTGMFASVVGLGSGWSVVYNSGTAGVVQLTYGSAATPTITRLSSNGTNTITSACEGTTLVIIGTNLTGTSEITVNGVALTGVNDVSSTRAEGVLPIGARVGPVVVTTPGGSVTSSGNLTVVENSTVVTAVTACDTYTWANNGVTYTTSGTYTGTTTSCVTQQLVLNIVVSPTPIVTTVSQCGGTYVWPANGVTYSASTNLNIIVGCTSETLNLTITAPTTTGSESVAACGTSYVWSVNGSTYTSSGTYTHVVGCNTATLTLILTPNTTTGSETVAACGSSYTWATSGASYTSSGTYTHVVGCNTATLTLTLTPATTTGSESVSVCGSSYTWALNGASYTSSGTYTHVVGCNTATLTLTLTPNTTTGSESVSACGSSYTWATSGASYTSSGTYTHVVGCNTATLTLTLTPETTTGSESVSACGSSYTWATSGASYTASGTYTHVVGCNTATLTLTLTPATTTGSEAVTACGNYTWALNGASYTSSGTYTYTVGCNTATLTLTLTPGTTTGSE